MTKQEFEDKCVNFSIKINKLRKYLREEHMNIITQIKFSVPALV